jgi:hypothetical protein
MTENTVAYDRLVRLGAPALPADRFYRIRFDDNGRLELQLRKLRKRFGSDLLAKKTVPVTAIPPQLVAGKVAAELAGLVARTTSAESVHGLLGNHHSKKTA